MIKAFIFDFDGVILDSVNIKTEAFAELFKKEGKEVIKKVIDYHLANTGVSRYDKFRYIYKEILKRQFSEEEFKKLCCEFESLVVEKVINAPYIKGAKEFLEAYAGRFKYFLISATPHKEIEEIIRRRNIDIFFRLVYGAPIKKNAAVREIISKENLNPAEVIYVGDALSDYLAAKDNSLKFIALVSIDDVIFTDINCLKIKDLTELGENITL